MLMAASTVEDFNNFIYAFRPERGHVKYIRVINNCKMNFFFAFLDII